MENISIVCTGGKGPLSLPPTFLLPKSTYIIAVDSGLDTANKLGLEVDYAIGDFDSLSKKSLLDNLAHTRLASHKDISDTEAALIHLKKLDIKDYILIGGGEGRFDHLLHLYSLFVEYGAPKEWITDKEHLFKVDNRGEFSFPVPSTVSFIPIHMKSFSTITCLDLLWPLKEFIIDSTHMSLSNVVSKNPIQIAVKGDPLFISYII